MSARIPPTVCELWLQFNLANDPEPMFSAVGAQLAPGTPMSQGIADSLLATAHAQVAPCVSSDYTLGPGHVIAGQDGADLRFDGSNAPTAGTAAALAIPNNTAYLFRKSTNLGGRRGRGRMYIPGVPENSVGPTGLLTAPALALGNTCANLLRTNLEATAELTQLLLLHESAPFVPSTIIALSCQTRVATQRRRMRP